jgi:hypothetical protein
MEEEIEVVNDLFPEWHGLVSTRVRQLIGQGIGEQAAIDFAVDEYLGNNDGLDYWFQDQKAGLV